MISEATRERLGIRRFKAVNYLDSPEMCLYYLLDSEDRRELRNHLVTVIVAIGRGYVRRDIPDRDLMKNVYQRVDIRNVITDRRVSRIVDHDIWVLAEIVDSKLNEFRDIFDPDPEAENSKHLETDVGQALFSTWITLLEEIGDIFYVDFKKGCLATTMSKVTDD